MITIGNAFVRNLMKGQLLNLSFDSKPERFMVIRESRQEPDRVWRARLLRISDERKFVLEAVADGYQLRSEPE